MPDDYLPPDDEELTFIERLTRHDMRAAERLGDAEVRYLVDAYYIAQEDRKRSTGQVRALSQVTDAHPEEEPSIIVSWLAAQNNRIEDQIKRVLDAYTQNHSMGEWMRGVYGIGPVIAAGLLAHIYMGIWCQVCHGRDEADCKRRQKDKKRALAEHIFQPVESLPTVGHIWQFAGIAGEGQHKWERGKKRPFNAKLKTLQWKAGQSFMKFSNVPRCYYGAMYRERKGYEVQRNEARVHNKPEIERRLKEGIGKPGTEAHTYLMRGLLPPAAIDGRARRYAAKQFLADMHQEWYRQKFGKEPPLPYPIAILGHAHQ